MTETQRLSLQMYAMEMLIARLLAANSEGSQIDLSASHQSFVDYLTGGLQALPSVASSQVEAELTATADRIFSVAAKLLSSPREQGPAP